MIGPRFVVCQYTMPRWPLLEREQLGDPGVGGAPPSARDSPKQDVLRRSLKTKKEQPLMLIPDVGVLAARATHGLDAAQGKPTIPYQ